VEEVDTENGMFKGRIDSNKKLSVPAEPLPDLSLPPSAPASPHLSLPKIGDYVEIEVKVAKSGSYLQGTPIGRSSLSLFAQKSLNPA